MFPGGWVRDDEAVEAVTKCLGTEAVIRFAKVADEPLSGYASRQIGRGNYGVFPHLSPLAIFGKHLAPYRQTRGTCVGCGTARAIEDSWLHSIAQRAKYGKPVRVDVASIYAGARTQKDLGGGRLSGDGAVGAWAAKWVHDWGAVAQGVYGNYNLVGLKEKLAVEWGNSRVPPEVIQAAKGVKISCFRCRTGPDVLDAAYAGYAAAFCWERTFGPKNADGISRLSLRANHCTELVGAAVTANGDPLILGQQSWGPDNPRGPNVLKYRDGLVELRLGMCAVPLEDIDHALRSGGECWAFEVVQGWR